MYTNTHIYIRTHIHKHTHTLIHTHTRIHPPTYTRTHTDRYTCTRKHTYVMEALVVTRVHPVYISRRVIPQGESYESNYSPSSKIVAQTDMATSLGERKF